MDHLRSPLDNIEVISFIVLKEVKALLQVFLQGEASGRIYKSKAPKRLNMTWYLLCFGISFYGCNRAEALSSWISLYCSEETVRLSFSIIGHPRKGWDQKAKRLVSTREVACWQNDLLACNIQSGAREVNDISTWQCVFVLGFLVNHL